MTTNTTYINEDILEREQRIRVEALRLAIENQIMVPTQGQGNRQLLTQASVFASYISGGHIPRNIRVE
jgi:hypothetical protein